MLNNSLAAAFDEQLRKFEQNATHESESFQDSFQLSSNKSYRTRKEIQIEHEKIQEKTVKEIDELYVEYSKTISRRSAESTGAIYVRYSSRFQDSIADQVRAILDEATRKKVFIPRELIFFDLAVRACKERRPGLTALRSALEANMFQTFLAFTTSRLYRKAYKVLQFVEVELIERNVRAIFVNSYIDTADGENWRAQLSHMATTDEAQVRNQGAHIRAAHEGLFEQGLVHTSNPLGYTGEIIPGKLTRRQKPRRKTVIDPEAAVWIVKIYRWYVVDGMSITAIVRKLNSDPLAPVPNKTTTGYWTYEVLKNHLQNPKYRGEMSYGVKQSQWSNNKDRVESVPRPKPLRTKYNEELRIVPDDCWFEAQKMLSSERANSGRKPSTKPSDPFRIVLRKLFVCPTHERKLAVGGPKAAVLFCPACRSFSPEVRPIFTHLSRELALTKTIDHLISMLREDEKLVDSIVEACQRECDSLATPEPSAIAELQHKISTVDSKIDYNRRNPGESVQEQNQAAEILKELRAIRQEHQLQLASYRQAIVTKSAVPTKDAVKKLLEESCAILLQGKTSTNETELRNARRIIDAITGGRIEIFQLGERIKHLGWLEGRFPIRIISFAVQQLMGIRISESPSEQLTTIDYRRPKSIDEQAEIAKSFWDAGLLCKEISQQMGVARSRVTKLLQHWFDRRGLPRPNGKKRGKQINGTRSELPVYQQIAGRACQLMDDGHSHRNIAKELKTSDATVAKAIAWWHSTQKLPVPNASDQRVRILTRAMELLDSGILLKDIANEVGYSERGLKLALVKFASQKGKSLPDGRTRRGNAKSGSSANGTKLRDMKQAG